MGKGTFKNTSQYFVLTFVTLPTNYFYRVDEISTIILIKTDYEKTTPHVFPACFNIA